MNVWIGTLSTFVACCWAFASVSAGDGVWRRHTIDRSSRGADGVKVADLNQDGLQDVVTGWEEGGVTRVCFHPGVESCRKPWPAVTVGSTASVEDATLVDLDGDGYHDVVSACEGRVRSLFVHWAPRSIDQLSETGKWRQDRWPAANGVTSWMFSAAAQIDGKHGADVLVGSKQPNGQVSWLQSPPDARDLAAWKLHRLTAAGWIMSLRTLDLDKDGDPDVLYSDRRGPNSGIYWLENVDGGSRWVKHPIGLVGTQEVMFVDIQPSKSTTWLLAAALKPHACVVLRPAASIDRPWEIAANVAYASETLGRAKAVKLGDLDQNGQMDVVVSCESARAGKCGLFVIQDALKTPTFAPIGGPEGVKFDRIELLDIDGDHDLDVLTCEEVDNLGVVWYENPFQDD